MQGSLVNFKRNNFEASYTTPCQCVQSSFNKAVTFLFFVFIYYELVKGVDV